MGSGGERGNGGGGGDGGVGLIVGMEDSSAR